MPPGPVLSKAIFRFLVATLNKHKEASKTNLNAHVSHCAGGQCERWEMLSSCRLLLQTLEIPSGFSAGDTSPPGLASL